MAKKSAPSDRRMRVDKQRAKIPDEPGVYLYSDLDGNVLYVGKAKNLKKRVNSYFTKSHGARTHALVMRIANIEVFAVGSEQEALVFERNLIKRHRPPFNVMLRDDKSYPFIAVTLGDEYPRVLFTREQHRRGVKYFGPYPSAKRVRITLDLLNRIFPYRPCEGSQPGRQSGVPCLDYHIERCLAPCVGYISKEDYRAVIDQVIAVLDGKVGPVKKQLAAKMQEASQQLEFEQAARLRNRLRDLEQVEALQGAEWPSTGSYDVIGVALGEGCANVQILLVRDGRLADRRSHYLDNTEGVDVSSVTAQFVLSYYVPGRPIPPQLVVQPGLLSVADIDMIEAELALQRSSKVELREAQRGEKRRLAGLATRNAVHALSYDSIRDRARTERRALALEELRDVLNLESLPLRIECYDISNLQDEAPVASMVVLEDGRPRKDHYRKFAMRHPDGQDDFAMMAEVIRRRFSRLNEAQLAAGPEHVPEVAAASSDQGNDAVAKIAEGFDDSFSAVPNLVLIDGGPGQLAAAVETLRELGVERVSICSLAKREELIHLPGIAEPIRLEHTDPALHLLQRIRDEAHRFALGYHRVKRSQDRHESVLDSLQGVGDARRRALLTFFGSPERVLRATLDEIESVPGLPGKVARSVYDQLNRLGGQSAQPIDRT